MKVRAIRDQQEYGGGRVTLAAHLGVARIPLQVDVGFGDVITPAPRLQTIPTLLDFPAPEVHTYPPETVIAEKFQAMVSLGIASTRLKDFFDVWTLARTREFDGVTLAQAIDATFQRRGTPIPSHAPSALTGVFDRLITLYLEEVTPTKGESKQAHDHRAAKVFRAFFDGRKASARRMDRLPSSLNGTDWAEFVDERRSGKIPEWSAVRDRQIEYDLKFLVAVLAWAEGADARDAHHLPKNPWSRERRRSQKMVMPREKNPKRPSMTEEWHEAIIDQFPNWRFEGVMELCRQTMHRRNSVRLLRWDDVDLASGTIRWPGEFDKNGLEIVTPLTPKARKVLQELPRVPGTSWVFPAEQDEEQPVSRHTLDTWLKRAKERAGIAVERLGFHGQKRSGVRRKEFRALPDPVREKLTGTSARTLDLVYDDVSVEDMREALEQLSMNGSRRGAPEVEPRTI